MTMIYLIDDKKLRQSKDYSWSNQRFNNYIDTICPIYNIRDLQEIKNELFQVGNIVLYHESFVDNSSSKADAVELRKKLEDFAINNESYLVLFSGSKNTRELSKNVANVSVSILYNNLEIFVNKVRTGDVNLNYLLFGDNPEIEKMLTIRQDFALTKTTLEETNISTCRNLIIRPDEKYISEPLSSYVEKIFFDNIYDKDILESLNIWLNEDLYDNIFIPLCFGSILSDYNGLRLACHIRCTVTRNQTSRIFIYGFVGLEYLLQNEYFNILKTKNSFLIPFSKNAIGESQKLSKTDLSLEDLKKELCRLKFEPPRNYLDNHSVANEWGVFQMARNANIAIQEIEGYNSDKFNSIYFRWLIIKNGLNESISEEQQQIQRLEEDE